MARTDSISAYAAAAEATKPFAAIIDAARPGDGIEEAARMAEAQSHVALTVQDAARFRVIAKRLRRANRDAA